MKTFDYLMPDTLNEAVQLSRQRGTRIKAGGTDLLGLLKEGVESPEKLVGLGQVPDLTGIVKRPGGGFSIGAMTTVSDIADHKELGHVYPVLTMAAKSVASPQLRNMGTVGGNICQRPRCWYFRGDFDCLRKGGDTCFAFDGENRFHCVVGGDSCFIVHPSDLAVALTALSATVLVRNTTSQLSVPMDQFFVLPEQDVTRETILEPGDIVTAIQVPGPPPGRRSVYLKTADRTVFDFATVSVAVLADVRSGTVHSARVVLGGVAPIPWVEKTVSRALGGIRLDDTPAIRKAAATALSNAEPLQENGYKVHLARNMIESAITQLNDLA